MNAYINNLSSEMRPSATIAGAAVTDQSLTVAGTAVAMIATALNDSTDAISWSLTGANAYYTIDGSDPVGGSNGHIVTDGSSSIWSKEMANAARWIREGAGSARLHISELQRR